MSEEYKVNPNLRDQFEALPINLKNKVLDAGIVINNMDELVDCVEGVLNKDVPSENG